jgi:hypothetical protein
MRRSSERSMEHELALREATHEVGAAHDDSP